LLGSSGGSAPGPLLALVASETLRHGVAAGIRMALALGRARHVLRSGGYSYLIRGLGLLLLAYALWFLCEGGRLLLARTAE